MMHCEEFAAQVSDYLDGRVDVSERRRMWLHRLMCSHCRRYLKQMRQVVALAGETGAADPGELSEATEQDLLAAFREKYASSDDT